jgi:hypothetical protein
MESGGVEGAAKAVSGKRSGGGGLKTLRRIFTEKLMLSLLENMFRSFLLPAMGASTMWTSRAASDEMMFEMKNFYINKFELFSPFSSSAWWRVANFSS